MNTYQRNDGSTYSKINRSLDSINKQTYQNWKLVLVGDGYKDNSEFEKITNLVDKDKIIFYNFESGYERDILKLKGSNLWHSAGGRSTNFGIDMAINDGGIIRCHMDDDDLWSLNHLETLANAYKEFPEAVFVYTRSRYLNTFLPLNEQIDIFYDNLPPSPTRLVHSSVSWRLDKITFKYRNIIEQGRDYPGDADMWERINLHCRENNLKTLYIPVTTVIKFDEATILK